MEFDMRYVLWLIENWLYGPDYPSAVSGKDIQRIKTDCAAMCGRAMANVRR